MTCVTSMVENEIKRTSPWYASYCGLYKSLQSFLAFFQENTVPKSQHITSTSFCGKIHQRNLELMTLEETLSEASIISQADAAQTRLELEVLGMTEQSEVADAGHANGNGHWAVRTKGPAEGNNVKDGVCSSIPLDSSPAYDTGTFKGSKLASDNHLGRMALIPHVTQTENHLGIMALVPHASQKLSIEVLRERLKDKLKEKLKPKLRRNLKHRQESSLPVIPWTSSEEFVLPNRNGDVALVEHDGHKNPFSSGVSPLKVLPGGVKTGEEQGVLDVPSTFFSLGNEATGQLVVANVSNGRRKAGSKSSQLSRVNRFADSILEFVGDRSVPEKLIRGALGNNPDISKAIRLLLSEKRLKRLGDGGKGCAYVYVRTDVQRSDVAEPILKTKELAQVDMNAQAMMIEQEFVRELERTFPATNKLDPYVWDRCGRMQGDQLQCDV